MSKSAESPDTLGCLVVLSTKLPCSVYNSTTLGSYCQAEDVGIEPTWAFARLSLANWHITILSIFHWHCEKDFNLHLLRLGAVHHFNTIAPRAPRKIRTPAVPWVETKRSIH